MDNFPTPPSTTINPNTTISTFNVILEEQEDMGHVQFLDYSTSEPYCLPTAPSFHAPLTQFQFLPYDPKMMVQNNTVIQPMYSSSYPMGESCVIFDIQNSQLQSQGWSSESQLVRVEENRRIREALSKMARDKRKQIRQRTKSSLGHGAPKLEGHNASRIELNLKGTMKLPQNKNPNVFCTQDGKRLKEILTKKLQNSDVSNLGRIVLPKRDVEEKLPALCDREGIDILLKDIYSDLQWSFKYRYWANNKSRMYVLENTGEFVKYYGLQMGDFVTLYKDELNNMYVSVEKLQNAEVSEPLLDKEMLHTQGPYSNSNMQTP